MAIYQYDNSNQKSSSSTSHLLRTLKDFFGISNDKEMPMYHFEIYRAAHYSDPYRREFLMCDISISKPDEYDFQVSGEHILKSLAEKHCTRINLNGLTQKGFINSEIFNDLNNILQSIPVQDLHLKLNRCVNPAIENQFRALVSTRPFLKTITLGINDASDQDVKSWVESLLTSPRIEKVALRSNTMIFEINNLNQDNQVQIRTFDTHTPNPEIDAKNNKLRNDLLDIIDRYRERKNISNVSQEKDPLQEIRSTHISPKMG